MTRIAAYCRLSRDEDRENYSSIEEQKRILMQYAKSQNWLLKDEDFYIDDNVSGYTFEREQFSLMMSKVRKGDIDVVLAKDLSRIGRNNGKVLVLIDEFKTIQKNLILVCEMGGVYDVLNDRDDTIGITTWYNERYVKDCSKKTRDHMLSKQKDGRLIMGKYYGYDKYFENDIPKLEIIEELQPVIQLIFKLYVEKGYGFFRISQLLNEKYHYPTPSAYYQRQKLVQGKVYRHKIQEKWTKDMVANIIGNEIYTGKLITHKKKTLTIRGKAVKLPKEQHFEFENHHEAIISKEMFDLAQEIRKIRNSKNSSSGTRIRNYLFSGMCECGECGSGVSGIMIRRKVKEKGYECSRYREYGAKGCCCHEIKEKEMLIQLKEFLKLTKEIYLEDMEKIKISIKTNKNVIDKNRLKNELRIANEEYKVLLAQKIKDITVTTDTIQREMIENTYRQLEIEQTQKILNIKKILEDNEKNLETEKAQQLKEAIDYFDNIIFAKEPNKLILRSLIDKVYIYHDKTIKFVLKSNISQLIENI